MLAKMALCLFSIGSLLFDSHGTTQGCPLQEIVSINFVNKDPHAPILVFLVADWIGRQNLLLINVELQIEAACAAQPNNYNQISENSKWQFSISKT